MTTPSKEPAQDTPSWDEILLSPDTILEVVGGRILARMSWESMVVSSEQAAFVIPMSTAQFADITEWDAGK